MGTWEISVDVGHGLLIRNFFARDILAVAENEYQPFFPSLSILLLSALSFRFSAKKLATAFNISRLRSLKLDKCPQVGKLFQHVIESNTRPQLRFFQLTDLHDTTLREFGNVSNHGDDLDEHRCLRPIRIL